MEIVYDILQEMLKVLVGLGLAGAIAYYIAYRELMKRAFWGRITFSLITFQDEKQDNIVIDTLLDKGVSEVWVNNRVLLGSVRKAAEQCSPEKPWLWIEGPTMYQVKSGLRHQLSSHFSQGAIEKAMGFPVEHTSFLVCLCAVHSEHSNSQKLRAFVIKEEVLKQVATHLEELHSSDPGREAVLNSLAKIWQRYQEEPRDRPAECVVHSVRLYDRK